MLAGWLVAAIERDVGPGADAALAARAGGFAVAWRARCVLVAVAGALVAAVLVSWPLAIGAFDRPPGGADVTAAVTAHLACGAVGGALALLLAAPVRPGSALVVFLGAVIASAVAGVGPAGVADALADAPDREITGALLVASGVALALAGALAAAARVLGRYRG